jgi:hypothetical protein
MNAEAKARRRARELCEAAEQFRRTGGIIERKETVKALPAEIIARIEKIEEQQLQVMQGLQVVLQALEDERAKREAMANRLMTGADELLKRA